ncbi:MAG: DNA-deoxyinosine glycosylase [Methanomassiliicoccales archaeon]
MAGNDDDGQFEHRIGFPPIVGEAPRVLILGTIPSVQSALKGEYYGNPRNQFWSLVHDIHGDDPSGIYGERTDYLKAKRIAVWDVFKNCHIIDSKDSSIKDEVYNDIQGFLDDHDSVVHVFLNGEKALEHYQKMKVVRDGRPFPAKKLPSSSPLHTIPYKRKLMEWSVVRKVIEENDTYSLPGKGDRALSS